MLTGIFDITVPQNNEYSITFSYFTSADVAINITDIVHFTVRRSALPQEKNMFEIISSGEVVEGYVAFPDTDYTYGDISVTSNIITLTVKTKTIAAISSGSYFYYLNLLSGDENTGILRGKFVVEAP